MDVSLRTCGRRRHLLLIYLFVLKAAANCPKPRASRNTVLTNKALLMNDFPDGSDATLECANGYVAESGSGVMSCAGGKWTEPDLSCKKKDCGPPRPQPNMSFNTSAGTLFGDIIRVICDKGYQIIGASYRQCYSAGWKGRAKCETVTCEKPAAVTGGRSLWDSQDDPKYGEVVRFACDEGLALAGRASITCGQAGEYDSGPPECRGVTTEERVTTEALTPTPAPPAQDLSAISTARRDKTLTTSATPTVSPSAQGGGRDGLTAEDRASTAGVTSTTTTSFRDKHDGAVDTDTRIEYAPVIVSVICISSAAIILVFCLHKFLLRKKGSSANGTAPIC
ncbi:complement decay-accelerating factor isoform X2 [Scophthalmus maximus]|uniref:complement decay-accelerating factor isoform X2 n=1 Tax=Scophthalmus maximus TaxID=52904 RepID=UPI0015E10C4D|nr:complement decay-accelerating factor isoform X2 [Scophthalmus maximus]